MDLRKLKTLIDLVSESNVSELEITEAEGKVRIVKSVGGVVQQYVAAHVQAPVATAPAAAAPPGGPPGQRWRAPTQRDPRAAAAPRFHASGPARGCRGPPHTVARRAQPPASAARRGARVVALEHMRRSAACPGCTPPCLTPRAPSQRADRATMWGHGSPAACPQGAAGRSVAVGAAASPLARTCCSSACTVMSCATASWSPGSSGSEICSSSRSFMAPRGRAVGEDAFKQGSRSEIAVKGPAGAGMYSWTAKKGTKGGGPTASNNPGGVENKKPYR